MGTLWAVTAYFNPMRFVSRVANYRAFRARLTIPLLTIELGFDGRFDLAPSDADVLVRRSGRDIMWHKELLLNAAIRALPERCTRVAWLDCDIVFADPTWAERAEALLDRHRLVQLFHACHRLGPREAPPSSGAPGRQPDCFSLAHLMENGRLPDDHFRLAGTSSTYRYTPGIAWAAHRAEIQARGLYEALILGSGDRALVSAACGRQRDFVHKLRMNGKQASHYLSWADGVHGWVRGDVTSLPGEVFHLWHGEVDRRRYCGRYEDLQPHGFDPHRDIARDPDGGWVWTCDKPELRRFVRRYFEQRCEDGASDALLPMSPAGQRESWDQDRNRARA